MAEGFFKETYESLEALSDLLDPKVEEVKQILEQKDWIVASRPAALANFIFKLVCLHNSIEQETMNDGYWASLRELEKMKLRLTEKLLAGEIKVGSHPHLAY